MSKPIPPELEEALQQLEIQALSFGTRFVNDSMVRQDYIQKTQQMSRELRAAYEAGSMSAREAAETANQLRNEIMELARVRSSDLGRAKAHALKAKGLDLDDLVAKYAKKMFDKDFAALTKGEQDRVLLEIVDSAGRANPKVSVRAARMGAVRRRTRRTPPGARQRTSAAASRAARLRARWRGSGSGPWALRWAR
jgi:hypothetical protein